MNKKTTAPKGPSTPLTAAATTLALVVASAAPPPPPPQQKAQVQLLERVLPSLVEFTAKTLILLAPSPNAPLVHKLNPSLPI